MIRVGSTAAQVNAAIAGTFPALLGITYLDVGPGRAVATLADRDVADSARRCPGCLPALARCGLRGLPRHRHCIVAVVRCSDVNYSGDDDMPYIARCCAAGA